MSGKRTGSANLPLHGGRVPAWLSSRMSKLGSVIAAAIVHEYGRDELLRRLAHPFWFQSFGAVMGMDWHSSGVTTSVLGALKRGLSEIEGELGVYVCGGKGAHSRKTPLELISIGERTGLDAERLAHSSRMVAKVDSAAVQDGYELYLHSFIVSAEGRWCAIQQGMNPARREARRYHWSSEHLTSFLDSPHAAIAGRNEGAIVNLADARAAQSRRVTVDMVNEGPDRTVHVLKRMQASRNAALDLFAEPAPHIDAGHTPHLQMPHRHAVQASDLQLHRLHGALAAAAARGPEDFAQLLLTPGVGARTIAALAFVAEVIHGAPSRFDDPARYSLALGGKDGHPFPVPLKVYDATIEVLKRAVAAAKLGQDDKLAALRRLDAQARRLERIVQGRSFESFVAAEHNRSVELGGRTVFD